MPIPTDVTQQQAVVDPAPMTQPPSRFRRWYNDTPSPWRHVFTALIVLTLIVATVVVTNIVSDKSERDTNALPTLEQDARECPDSWLMAQADHENNRWFSDGIPEIRNASTPEQAREAAKKWLGAVRRDEQLLSGAYAYFTGRQVEPTTLVAGKCASPAAATTASELELAISDPATRITPAMAPTNATNSGVDSNGNVVASPTPGLSGDRRAIHIVLKDGREMWILGRCGQITVIGPAPVPPGPTDQPPQPTGTTPTTTPGEIPTTQPPTPTVPTTPPPGTTPPTVPPTTPPTLPPTPTTTPPTPTTVPQETPPTTEKPRLSRDCQQNNVGCPSGVNNPFVQPPQDNTTSGVHTGPTPGAPAAEPAPSPQGPAPAPSTPAPPPYSGGYNSGSNTGSGTPSGSTGDSTGTQTGNNNTSPPVNSGQGGSNTAPVANPFG